jgi:dihydroneopterin aldolase
MQGRIRISGIRFHAFHGLTRLERQVGVRHRVDLAMTTDLRPSAEGDRIEDTIDYREVHDVVVRVGRQNSFHLIETLAVKICREILRRFPGCSEVEAVVTKETPVVDGMVDTVGVELTLSREDLGDTDL